MEFEIKSFMEMNLIVDAVLLLIFSFTVLLRNPKFLIFLVLLNLCQYIIWVPDREILEAHKQLRERAEQAEKLKIQSTPPKNAADPAQSLSDGFTSGNPVQMSGQAMKIYDQVLQGMGAGEGSATTAMEVSLGAWKKNLTQSEKENPEGFSYSPMNMLLQAGHGDMQAAWFIVRLFWLAATFYLYVQRPQIGATVFAFNLLPIPFLANFVPFLWFRFNELKWVKDLNLWAEVGTLPGATVDFLLFYGMVFVVLGLPIFIVLLAGLTQWRKTKDTGLRGYLDPSRYNLSINGSTLPFEVNDNELLAGDFRLNIKQLSYDPENPHIWYLRTGTKVEFVEKY